jgi:catechol 2,3-dioxygenase-like lactoylglutathione lyase family enzyme
MIKGMNHVGLSVSNLDRAFEFYRDLLGMEIASQGRFGGEWHDEKYDGVLGLKGAAGRAATLRLGDMGIELFEFEHPRPNPVDPNRPVCDHGITHFCLQVTDIYGEYARLKSAGVVFHCPPQDFGKGIATYGRDPDGNVFELLENREGA